MAQAEAVSKEEAGKSVKRPKTTRRRRAHSAATESGVALLISLFALLLICVVGMALLMATGTDSALTGNYRSANTVYYAALAGVEEGRTRLLSQWPVASNTNLVTALGLPAGTVPAVGQAWYILNPQPGEVVAPWDTTNPATYPDLEWAQEFPATPLPTTAPGMLQTNSLSAINSPWGQLYTAYKWVRINAISAPSAKTAGVNVDNDTGQPTTPLTFVGNHLSVDQPGPQALEITALASLTMPNGTQSQRMVQYVTAPIQYNMTFNAPATLDGTGVSFAGSNAVIYNGQDACVPGAPPLPGVGYTNAGDAANILGAGGSNLPASVVAVPTWQTFSGLSSLVAMLIQYNDALVNKPNATQNDLPGNMTPTNPMTVVVNGNLDLTGWSGTGYGILLVTGTLTYDPNSSWNGIVLVIGQGHLFSTLNGAGTINGAVLVAKVLADDGTPLAALGQATWQQNFGGGINYSSCWINSVQRPVTYKVLSFREIPVNGP